MNNGSHHKKSNFFLFFSEQVDQKGTNIFILDLPTIRRETCLLVGKKMFDQQSLCPLLIAQLVLFPLYIFSFVVECIMRSLSDVGLTSLSSGPLGLWFTWAARPVKKKSTRLQIESTYIFPHSQKKFRIEIYQQKGICGLLWKFFKSKKGSRNGRTDYQLQQDVGILCTPRTWFVNVPQWYDGSSLISIHCMQMQLTWFWLQNIYWHHVI